MAKIFSAFELSLDICECIRKLAVRAIPPRSIRVAAWAENRRPRRGMLASPRIISIAPVTARMMGVLFLNQFAVSVFDPSGLFPRSR